MRRKLLNGVPREIDFLNGIRHLTDRMPRLKALMQTETQTGLGPARPWLRALEVLAWSAFFVVALALLAVRYWFLPNVEHYREDIAAALTRATGLKVSIGAVEAGWRGLRPDLAFSDVRVFDRDGREALALPSVEAVASWRSLLTRELHLHSLVLHGSRLKVQRDAKGVVYVAGIKLAAEGGEGRFSDWILSQKEIQILDAEIEWLDEKRAAPALALQALNLRLRNDGDVHAIGLSARPPRELGTSLDLRAELTGQSVTEPAAWNGRFFVEVGYTDLAGWRAWADYPLDVRQGQGALRLWASVEQGSFTRTTVDLALTRAAARLGADLPLLELASVRGRLQWRQTPEGYEFGVRRLALEPVRGPATQAASFQVTWRPGNAQALPRGAITAERVELVPLTYLMEFVPVSGEVRKLVTQLEPKGEFLDTRFDWTGELPEPATFAARARFSGLGINAWRAVPGFAGLSGRVEASESKGGLNLASRDLQVDLPKVFPESRIALKVLDGDVRWDRRSDGGLQVRIGGLNYANDDLAGTALGTYEYPPAGGPGSIDLSAQLTRVDGRQIGKYLPRPEILGAPTRTWLVGAILAGEASDARLRLKGDLRHFPFVDRSKGQFQISAHVKGGVLEYAEGWPRIENIEADLLFERDGMQITGRSGNILGTAIANVRVTIPSMGARPVLLTVNGGAEGPTSEFLAYIQRSPVRGMIGGFTDTLRADGRGRLQLRLDLPLSELSSTRVAGEYRFASNHVIVDPRLPPVARASGRVNFTESALSISDVRGEFLGGGVTISGGSKPQAGVTIVARGDATLQGIGAVFDHPLRAYLTGGAPYTATVTAREGRTQITFESPLRGVQSTLPPPLAKAPGEALPLRVDVFPGADADRILVAAGTVATAEFQRVRQDGAMVVQRAGLLLSPAPGDAPRLPERRGTNVQGSLRVLNLDQWLPLFGNRGGDSTTNFDLRLGTLDLFGKRLTEVRMRGAAESAAWSANVASKELAGDIAYRSEDRGKLTARLKHFRIPDDAPVATAPEARATAAAEQELPAVDLLAESFTHGNLRLGRVEVLAHHEAADWRIDRFSVVNPEGSLLGKGLVRLGGAPRTALEMKLESSDVGKLIERLGHAGRVRGGKGSLEGRLEWNGAPTAIDFDSLSGELSLHVEGGEYPRLDAGMGRVLSVVSLNFAEAAAKGYAFDVMSGAFTLAKGVAHTEDLKVSSSAAEVSMKGDLDLGKEVQDLHVRVIPSMRRSVTTLATIVSPAVALGVAVGQAVLKDPIGQILAVEYRVTGALSDPKVDKLAPPVLPKDESGRPAGAGY